MIEDLLDHDRRWNTRSCRAAEADVSRTTLAVSNQSPTRMPVQRTCRTNKDDWGCELHQWKGKWVLPCQWHEWTDVRVSERMNAWMNERMHEWIEQWTNRSRNPRSNEPMTLNQAINQSNQDQIKSNQYESTKSNQIKPVWINQIKSNQTKPNQIKSIKSHQAKSNIIIQYWCTLLPPTTSYYLLLPPTTSCYLLLPPTTPYYLLLPPTTSYYLLLPPKSLRHLRYTAETHMISPWPTQNIMQFPFI